MTAREDVLRLSLYLDENRVVKRILGRADDLELPNWYLGAGCIPQTAWNLMHGFSALDHIRDYDLTYLDPTDTSYKAEDKRIRAAAELFADLPVLVEVRNQARVHLWHEDPFGYSIERYRSVEEAIASWPTTASAIGVRGTSGQYRTECEPPPWTSRVRPTDACWLAATCTVRTELAASAA